MIVFDPNRSKAVFYMTLLVVSLISLNPMSAAIWQARLEYRNAIAEEEDTPQ